MKEFEKLLMVIETQHFETITFLLLSRHTRGQPKVTRPTTYKITILCHILFKQLILRVKVSRDIWYASQVMTQRDMSARYHSFYPS